MIYNWRNRSIVLICLVLLIMLGVKLVRLMTFEQDFLAKQGHLRSDRVITEYASRGLIFDRNHRILAESMPSANVGVRRQDFAKVRAHAAEIAKILNITKQDVIKNLTTKRNFLVLQHWLAPDAIAEIKAKHWHFLEIDSLEKRYYPFSYATASLLGMVNASGFGQEGLERAYDKMLQSVSGKVLVENNLKGEFVQAKTKLKDTRQSQGLQLTIDAQMQTIAYDELTQGLADFGAESGSVTIIAPKTGEILAMVSAPSFNPNNVSNLNFNTVRNRALMDLFEPGSTIKPFTIAAAFASKQYNMDSLVDTGTGKLNLYGYQISDETKMHGLLNIPNILKKSSNVAISKIGLSLPPNLLPELLINLGFTKPALNFPGEAVGNINARSWQYKVEQAALAYGYGINASALELAHAYAILANAGVDPGLHLTLPYSKNQRQVIASSTAKQIMTMLEGVVEPGGTAYAARIKGVKVSGKTGTTRIATKGGYQARKYVASFIGMFPAENPEFLVLVVVNKPNLRYYFGGRSAAPIFARIGKKLVRLKQLNQNLDPTIG